MDNKIASGGCVHTLTAGYYRQVQRTGDMSMDNKIVYCHFSFRRPSGKGTVIMATCLYADEEGKRQVARKVREEVLWENHQHVTAIQAYAHALRCIWEWQGKLLEHGVTDVVLVTDNSILAGWIMDHKKNTNFTHYMKRAVSPYRVGGSRWVVLSVGLAEPRVSEKSYKYCKQENVEHAPEQRTATAGGASRMYVHDASSMSGVSVMDLAKELHVEGSELEISKIG